MPKLTFPLVAAQPIVELHLSGAAVRTSSSATTSTAPVGAVVLRALIDTGAKQTCVDAAAIAPIGLSPVTTVGLRTASTGRLPVPRDVYDLSVSIAGAVPVQWMPALRAIAIDLSWSKYRCLVGRDVLEGCRFTYDGPAGQYVLEF